MKGFDP